MNLPTELSINGLKIKLDFSLNCKSENVIYLAKCVICGCLLQFYFGQTVNPFRTRMNGHRGDFKVENSIFEKSALSMHVFNEHIDDFDKKLTNYDLGIIKSVNPSQLDRVEDFYIFKTRADITGLNRYNVTK